MVRQSTAKDILETLSITGKYRDFVLFYHRILFCLSSFFSFAPRKGPFVIWKGRFVKRRVASFLHFARNS